MATTEVEKSVYKRLKVRAAEEDVDIQDLATAIIDWALEDKDFMDELIAEEFPEDEDDDEDDEDEK